MIVGKRDSITKDYMENPARFADLFNGFCFHGAEKVAPDKLRDMDTTSVVVPYGTDGVAVPTQKYRDVLKVLTKTDGKTAYCILGVENQSEIHTAMPVRNMLYDAMTFANQISAVANSRKNNHNKACNSAEFLSGFYRSDKLLPVITIVVHWGADEWDAPLSLQEMYPKDIDDSVRQYSPDYHINLVSPAMMSDDKLDFFKSDLREVLKFIKYSKDKQRIHDLVDNNPKFKSLNREAVQTISVCANVDFKIPEGEEQIDMCKAIEDMKEDVRMEERLTAIRNLMKKMGWSAQEAMDALMLPADEQKQYSALI
ncbi:Rpn family recombination-promoting nuclease/putative transposase [Anaerovibrio sp. RM50]|uniref:Rpn family recombination-promoting nuclease/putative transposase n=1 Tax=Anaerovibrio sp. RM50 TaxID=1200557 RepID=UPI000565AF28|nr:Rpn family recombination-promoting nuclease/putative transposase [Anaerovibrio sp. RM50]